MENQDKSRILLDMQEHPEKYTDEQLRQLFEEDKELAELAEHSTLAKRAFTKQEAADEEIEMDDLWQQFSNEYKADLEKLDARQIQPANIRMRFRKLAAIIIGTVLVSSIAYAAAISLGIVSNPLSHPNEQIVVKVQRDTTRTIPVVSKDTIPQTPKVEPEVIIFENKSLPTILSAMAAYYHLEITYTNNEVKNIRLLFEWDQKKSLDDNLMLLNSFQQINITHEGNHLTVE